MTTTVTPTPGSDINLQGTAPNNERFLSNSGTSVSYNNFNGNGTQNTTTAGGGTGDLYQVTNNTAAKFVAAFNLNGATVQVDKGSSITVNGDFTNAFGGTVNIDGGKFTVGNNFNGNTALINVTNGGTLSTGSAIYNANSAIINLTGSTLNITNNVIANANGGFINFGGATGSTVNITNSQALSAAESTLVFKNFGSGDVINLPVGTGLANDTYTSTYTGSTLVVTDTTKGTTVLTLKNFSEPAGGGNPAVTYNKTTGNLTIGTFIAACFLADSMIRTPHGDVPVQDVSVGDELIAVVDGEDVVRTVIWTGSNVVNAHHIDTFPVRIRKDAIADGVPFRDLLVTPEHCLFLDGAFVPARMLVNGRSIVSDSSLRAFEVFHLETAGHSVIVANGMLNESYLDTGNRANFISGSVLVPFAAPKTWAADAAAQLVVDRGVVEPLFLRLQERAIAAGVPLVTPAPAVTTDPDLHLVTEWGVRIDAANIDGRMWRFELPAGTARVSLVSRTSRPSDAIGAYVDDRRELGVLAGRIALAAGETMLPIDGHLTIAGLSGWHAIDAGSTGRWTSGRATLPIGAALTSAGPTVLEIEILGAGPYLEAATYEAAA